MFYTSLRLNELFNIYGLKEANEIGAGLGYAAYYFSRINHNTYNIYDLPAVLILQAYFLMSSIGENKIYWLFFTTVKTALDSSNNSLKYKSLNNDEKKITLILTSDFVNDQV